MRICLNILFVLGVTSYLCAQHSTSRLADLPTAAFDSLIHQISKKEWTVTEKMGYFSRLFLGTPYELNCVGDGPYALYEPWPLVNFNQTNCMAMCEHILALSISDSWENFFNNLQQIRYEDGIIGIKTRNHYVMADWLPQNQWLLEDATARVGEGLTQELTRTISHQRFFTGKGITDLSGVKPDRTITVDYIPLVKLATIKKRLQTGDIVSLIFARLDNIFSAHLVMIIQQDGDLIVREASNSKMTTFDTPFDKWVMQKQKQSGRYIGIVVLRVRDDRNQPGFVVDPRQIFLLK